MHTIEAFLHDIDAAWRLPGAKVTLRVIGSTALMLQSSYDRGTKDSDVLETDEITGTVAAHLIDLAGRETAIHSRRGLYIDIVKRGVPFRRQMPRYRAFPELNASLAHIGVEAMSVIDVVVSKLARFTPNDRSDIDAMIARDLVEHGGLVSCFLEAVDFKQDITVDEFTCYVENLHVVERDMLGVAETQIEEPSWLR